MKLHRKGLVDEFGRVAAITAAIAGFTLLPVATATAQDDDTVEVESLQGNQAGDQEELNAVNEEATALGAIQITGSRLRRTDFETAQPVLVLTREDIERTGLVSIGDILQNIPQAGAALNTAFNNGGTGATEIDLRNLGSNRVLVLVNGRRWVGGVRSLNTSGVDLNTIPEGWRLGHLRLRRHRRRYQHQDPPRLPGSGAAWPVRRADREEHRRSHR